MANKRVNPMLNSLQAGETSLARIRLDVPMWSPDHIEPVIDNLENIMRALKSIKHSNSVPNKYKPIEARSALRIAAAMLREIQPGDPRERGSEDLRFTGNGLIDHNGFDHFDKPEFETSAQDDLRENSQMWKIREGRGDDIKEQSQAQQDQKKPEREVSNRTKGYLGRKAKRF